jgi:hypothetical protein
MISLGIISAYSQNKMLINKRDYNLTENKILLKDYNLMATSRQFTNSKGAFQFGYILNSIRNDSLFISGNIKIIKREIICSEKYYFDYFEKDSIIRIFKQNKNGTIKLENYKEYKNGKITIEYH